MDEIRWDCNKVGRLAVINSWNYEWISKQKTVHYWVLTDHKFIIIETI